MGQVRRQESGAMSGGYSVYWSDASLCCRHPEQYANVYKGKIAPPKHH
jgi:hypothetical protein